MFRSDHGPRLWSSRWPITSRLGLGLASCGLWPEVNVLIFKTRLGPEITLRPSADDRPSRRINCTDDDITPVVKRKTVCPYRASIQEGKGRRGVLSFKSHSRQVVSPCFSPRFAATLTWQFRLYSIRHDDDDADVTGPMTSVREHVRGGARSRVEYFRCKVSELID